MSKIKVNNFLFMTNLTVTILQTEVGFHVDLDFGVGSRLPESSTPLLCDPFEL